LSKCHWVLDCLTQQIWDWQSKFIVIEEWMQPTNEIPGAGLQFSKNMFLINCQSLDLHPKSTSATQQFFLPEKQCVSTWPEVVTGLPKVQLKVPCPAQSPICTWTLTLPESWSWLHSSLVHEVSHSSRTVTSSPAGHVWQWAGSNTSCIIGESLHIHSLISCYLRSIHSEYVKLPVTSSLTSVKIELNEVECWNSMVPVSGHFSNNWSQSTLPLRL
jgi:hypothetical protein